MKSSLLTFTLLLGIGISTSSAQNHTLDFDGLDDYVNCNNNSSVRITGDSITLEAWIYPKSWQPNVWEGNIINKELNGPNNGYMLRAGDTGRLNFNLGSGVWNELNSSAPVLVLNQWQHVAGVYDGIYMRIYVDGVATDSMLTTFNIADATGKNLTIGSWSSVGRHFNGQIDEVRVWNTARSRAEILAGMNAEICNNEPGLVAYYKFNQGNAGANNSSVTSLIDATINSNNGTLVGFALNGSTSNWIASANPIPQTYTPATAPTLSTSIPAICIGSPDSSTISLSGGILNDASRWSIRNSSCNSSVVGTTTGNQFKVKPSNSRTFYVRGDGGCADAGPCSSIQVILAPRPETSFDVTNELFGNDGAIDQTITVGTPPFKFDWNNDGVGDWDDTEDLTGLTGGTYTVIVEDSNLCLDTAWAVVEAGTAIGISDKSNESVNIYPNPTKNFLYIDLKNSVHPIEKLVMVSILGNVVQKFEQLPPKKVNKLELKNVEAGIYFLKFNWQGQSTTKRVIVK